MAFRLVSCLLASSLLLLACSQTISQNVVLGSKPSEGTFSALGGAGLDPSVTLFCSKGDIKGDKGFAHGTARQYREHLNTLMRLTSGGQYGQTGSIYGGDVKPSTSPIPTQQPSYYPSATASPTASATATATAYATATSDISVVEKTTFNGKLYDENHQVVDNATVTAKSLNSSVPYEAKTTTAGGSFAFNNAPAGVTIEIIATIPGYAPRRRVEVLKSNKQGDPDANRYDFGTDGADTSAFGVDFNGISNLPEIVAVTPGRNASGVSAQTDFILKFSEPMDRSTVEQGIQILKYISSTEAEPAFDVTAFDVSWNSEETEIRLKFKPGYTMDDHEDYYVGFKPNTLIKDKTGVARDSGYFKLTDGDYEDKYKFSILGFMTQALPEESATPSPLYTPLPPAEKTRDHYYFSYDDSASVAGVELTKHALTAGRMPDPAWARTWEFLNYEPFDHINQESASSGQFQVSLGLWKYNHPDNPYLANYEVGAHVTAPYLCKETRQALNLTVLVDISSSMNEKAGLASAESGEVPSKIALAKAGLHDLVDSLRPGDIIHLVEFSNKPFVQLDKFIVGSSPQQDYLAAVDKLSADGGTNLQAAIDAGYRQAQQLFDKNKLNRLLLITDAQPTEGITDIEKIKSMAALNNDAGIYLSALGMGHTHNQQLLNNMTEAGRGAYYTIQTRADIKEAMHDRFIPLMNVIARNVRFKLDFPGWMRHGKTAAEQVSADPSEVQPTNFSANTSQYFWEQFQANKTDFQPGQTVKLTISYDDPVSGNERSEIFEKRLDQMLDQDLNNIKAAHLIQLSTALIKHEITAREVDRELRELLPDTGK